jgi:hypothetical protein
MTGALDVGSHYIRFGFADGELLLRRRVIA